MLTKRCRRCGTEKETALFYPQKTTRDGQMAWCKPCCSDYQRGRKRARVAITRSAPPPTAPSTRPVSTLLFYTDESLPNIAIIPIRPDWDVMVGNIPADLTKAEADRIERILKAFTVDDPMGGSSR